MFSPNQMVGRIIAFAAASLIALGAVLNGNAFISFIQYRFFETPNQESILPTSQELSGNQVSEDTALSSSNFDGDEPKAALETLPLSTSKFGHYPFSVANSDLMSFIGSYAQGENQRFEMLLPEADLALMKLIYAARDDGVWIVPVSAFRDFSRQEELFENQVQKRGTPELAAKVSAPPGYSEHHTGYAVDLTDGRFPQQDITLQFAETDAFRWLQAHASEFGFELSFPKNNFQGISYEPWHWRFVGSQAAQVVFSQAMN